GLGKTVEAMAVSQMIGGLVLMLFPKSLFNNWFDEIQGYFGEDTTFVQFHKEYIQSGGSNEDEEEQEDDDEDEDNEDEDNEDEDYTIGKKPKKKKKEKVKTDNDKKQKIKQDMDDFFNDIEGENPGRTNIIWTNYNSLTDLKNYLSDKTNNSLK